eukprot:m.283172 g.283172  ORF g.283172 m.283172 type:complete len:711 (+) comp19871_c0_seq7:211-2343(+)
MTQSDNMDSTEADDASHKCVNKKPPIEGDDSSALPALYVWDGKNKFFQHDDISMAPTRCSSKRVVQEASGTSKDALAAAYAALVMLLGDVNKSDVHSWRPSWVALGVDCCDRTISAPNSDSAVGVKLGRSLSYSGTLVCSHVDAVHPDRAAAASGVAVGDVVLEVDGCVVLDCDPMWVTYVIATAWHLHGRVKLVLMPASTARMLTRPQSSSHKETASYGCCIADDGGTDTQDAYWEHDAVTDTVVMGLFWLPVSKSSADPECASSRDRPAAKRAGVRASALAAVGRMFGRGTGGNETPQGRDAAQTARAVVLDRAVTLWQKCRSLYIAQEWLDVVRPTLVKEFGENLVGENDVFLRELMSSYEQSVVGDRGTRGCTQHPDLHIADGGGFELGISPEFSLTEDGPKYVYHDTEGEDSQGVRHSALQAAQAAWEAEKQRRRATHGSSDVLAKVTPELSTGSGINEDNGGSSADMAAHGADSEDPGRDTRRWSDAGAQLLLDAESPVSPTARGGTTSSGGKRASMASRARRLFSSASSSMHRLHGIDTNKEDISISSDTADMNQGPHAHVGSVVKASDRAALVKTHKAAAQARNAEQARAALQAAEAAWEAEKQRMHATTCADVVVANRGVKESLAHVRAPGGRVSQKSHTQHVVSIEPTTAPEPNRPWFGGQLKSRRATHDSDSASDDGDTEEDVPSSIPMHTRTGTTTDL